MRTSPLLDSWFLARAARFRALQPRPRDDPWVRIVGGDPLRVLVTGAGLAAGYGVDRHEQGLAGHLARAIATRTGRGVIAQTRAVPVMRAQHALNVIGRVGAHTFDAVVFAGCHLEAGAAPGASPARHVAGVIEHLQATGPAHLRIVVAGLPVPGGASRLDRRLQQITRRSNHALKDAAEGHERVSYVPVPAFGSVHDRHPFDAAYYGRAAHDIAEDGLWDFGSRRTGPGST